MELGAFLSSLVYTVNVCGSKVNAMCACVCAHALLLKKWVF